MLLLVVGLVISVLLVGKKTFFGNKAATLSDTNPSSWGNAAYISSKGTNNKGFLQPSPTSQGPDFTFEAWINHNGQKWFNPPDNFQDRQFIIDAYDLKSTRTISVVLEPDKRVSAQVSTVNNGAILIDYVVGKTVLPADTWYHVAIVRNQSNATFSIYINGILDGQSSNNIRDNSLLIFNKDYYFISTNGNGYAFQGLIDEVRESNFPRYLANFSKLIAPFTSDGNTQGLWHMDEQICNTSAGITTCWTPDSSPKSNSAKMGSAIQLVPSTIPVSTPPPVPATYKICQKHACAVVQGIGVDSCQSDSNCNKAPTADYTYVSTPIGKNSVTVQFTNKSSDPDGDSLASSWNFGDGATSTLSSPSHTYKRDPKKRSYTATLTITDGYGGQSSKSQSILIF